MLSWKSPNRNYYNILTKGRALINGVSCFYFWSIFKAVNSRQTALGSTITYRSDHSRAIFLWTKNLLIEKIRPFFWNLGLILQLLGDVTSVTLFRCAQHFESRGCVISKQNVPIVIFPIFVIIMRPCYLTFLMLNTT